MTKYLAIVFIIAIIGMIFTYQNCGDVSLQNPASIGPTDSSLQVTGMVKTLDLDGCGKVIISDSDKTSTYLVNADYLKNLPDQTHVSIEGHVNHDSITACMVGVNLDVDKLEVVQ